ncbi:pyridine nucleotide-disulfide oxidoreductase/dicluster-binding protein [Desulfoluna spongiiphila]|uniref:Aldehyde dehydrogenase, iron-sulfur subunit n=1 Tax=Desulfoluna spongiiphila TaxID=419481 RepID=A0A1G5E294_9BACT|nr:pyridine nucleotide-disulfide oxidoreductase/dicluster-binding protein [Desulfoluna spongiiphila]SCY21129.1 aldehyde dehydrogenase, iron-sulfur subunit [Desulfoluna spongiiphila]
MEQKELRELEQRCIQDEPPFCTAACPLHMDARLFLQHMAHGKTQAARKILDKTLPFPAILGRICDHPCEARCRLGEAGDPIAIGALERACVSSTPTGKTRVLVPQKEKRVALVGSGMSSLTAAWDLVRKGYPVHLIDPAPSPGGTLQGIPEATLPRGIIADALAELREMGVQLETTGPMDSERIDTLCTTFDAVYVGLDSASEKNPVVTFTGDPSGSTDRENLFAGGRSTPANSPVLLAAQGRWAATSMDRFLQNVSMTAGRETEGAVTSRLYTNMDGVAHAPRTIAANPNQGYTPEEASTEATRCIQCECLECVKVCPYLEKYKGSPREYVRRIYNNLSIVKGTRTTNKMINSCNLCGLCETVCPTGFSMAEVCHTSRQHMVETGKMPPSAHEFALLDMAFSNSDDFFLVRHAPGESSSAWLFFPGCQLGGASPAHVAQAYGYLRETHDTKTGLMLGCCGAPAHWGGDVPLFESVLAQIKAGWKNLGNPQIITACSSCQSVFSQFLPEADTVSLWSLMADHGLPATVGDSQTETLPLAVIDPCTARHETNVQKSVRLLLNDLGATVEELPFSGERTECCGFGGLMSNADPDVARDLLERRVQQSPLDYLTYCVVCRDHLASTGKKTSHLFDLIWPENRSTNPGYSLRQENRTRLKSNILKTLWHEESEPEAPHRKIPLQIAPDVQDILESRRILKEDIQQVLYHVKNGGEWLTNPTNGHRLASYKPRKVTFWVEYQKLDDAWEIYNAYCHRMTVAKGDRQ